MRKLTLIILLFAAGISLANAAGARGNGNIVTREKSAGPFDRVYVGGRAIINYRHSEEYRVLVTIDSNLEERLDIFTRNNTLNIGPKHGQNIFPTEFIVDVYSPSLSGVSLSGSVEFNGKDTIKTKDFKLNISGSGKAEGTIECENFSTNISGSGLIDLNVISNTFSADISGSGKINLSGSSGELDVLISGSGSFDGGEFQTNNASVRVSGSASIYVLAVNFLRVRISGSGGLRYRGNPIIDFNISGTGQLGKGGW